MRLSLLPLLLIAVVASSAAEWTPYADATAETAKQAFHGNVLVCSYDGVSGEFGCESAASCRGNCSLVMQQVIAGYEPAPAILPRLLFCFSDVHTPRQW